MKRVLYFKCPTLKGTAAMCVITGAPDFQAGDTFDLPIFGGLGEAKVISRYFRSERKDQIIYCEVDEIVMKFLEKQSEFIAPSGHELANVNW